MRSYESVTCEHNRREGYVQKSSSEVSKYLPLLRRYARALTGEQSSGDAYVAATLEALIADPTMLKDAEGVRVGLYRLFTKICSSLAVNGNVSGQRNLAG